MILAIDVGNDIYDNDPQLKSIKDSKKYFTSKALYIIKAL